MKVAVIGGGAAGVFAAISVKTHHPEASVVLLEKSNKLLAKVKISGGGRCNVTHHCHHLKTLVQHYPRGGNSLKKVLGRFMPQNTFDWFAARGIKLKTEADNRVFPVSNSSQTIIDCFVEELAKLGVEVRMKSPVSAIRQQGGGWVLSLSGMEEAFDKVIIATGGSPTLRGLAWLAQMGFDIVPPVPSLFTFNLAEKEITQLAGVATPVEVRIVGFNHMTQGPMLITHWGFSGPAVLRMSAFAARFLHDKNYEYEVALKWVPGHTVDQLREILNRHREQQPKKKTANQNPFGLPNRLWLFLLGRAGLSPDGIWGEAGKKELNRLVAVLAQDVYRAKGKTTFKEEFVTAGGVALGNINMRTMESKAYPGLYFAGEVLDIDGVTGGFNFQAAWATGYVAGQLG